MASPSKAGNRLAAMSLVIMCVVALLPAASALLGLSTDEKLMALHEHNRVRRIVSPPACPPLAPLKWDSELARVAQIHANKCKFQHNTNIAAQVGGKYWHVGENVFYSYGRPLSAQTTIHAWDSEKAYYDLATGMCEQGKVCGHYTQLVWASTTHVGCGATRCPMMSRRSPYPLSTSSARHAPYHVLYVCDYGPTGNFNGLAPYKKC